MPGLPPVVIVLAVGGAVVGGPEALRLLLALEQRTAAADVVICVFLFCTFTALLLGTLLVARLFRDANAHPGAGAAAPGTERFARVTLAVALGRHLSRRRPDRPCRNWPRRCALLRCCLTRNRPVAGAGCGRCTAKLSIVVDKASK